MVSATAARSIGVLLLAAEAAGGLGEVGRQREFAAQALARGDTSGWGHYWTADSYAEPEEAARRAYQTAVQSFKQELSEGVPPRRAARLWQAVYLAAERLGDEELAAKAARRAGSEAAVCEALGADIESVAHRRSVPSAVFVESLPETGQGSDPDSPSGRPDGKSAGNPAEAAVLRASRLSRGLQGRGG